MKIIQYLCSCFFSIGVLRLIPRLINHFNEGYPAASLIGVMLAILLFGALEIFELLKDQKPIGEWKMADF